MPILADQTVHSPAAYAVGREQAGAYIGVSPRTLDRWRTEGRGPKFSRVNGRVVYRMKDLETFVDRRVEGGVA